MRAAPSLVPASPPSGAGTPQPQRKAAMRDRFVTHTIPRTLVDLRRDHLALSRVPYDGPTSRTVADFVRDIVERSDRNELAPSVELYEGLRNLPDLQTSVDGLEGSWDNAFRLAAKAEPELLELSILALDNTPSPRAYVPTHDPASAPGGVLVSGSYGIDPTSRRIVPTVVVSFLGVDEKPYAIDEVGFDDVVARTRAVRSFLRGAPNVRREACPFEDAFGARLRPDISDVDYATSLYAERRNEGEIAARLGDIVPMDHQINAVRAASVKHMGRSIVGLEPGLGKTGVGCLFADVHRSTTNVLVDGIVRDVCIVCPKSKIKDWRRDYVKWTGRPIERKHVMSYDGVFGRAGVRDTTSPAETLELVLVYMSRFRVLVIDECHELKTEDTRRSNVLVPAFQTVRYVIMLSGTLMPNRPSELYNMLRIAEPEVFTEERRESYVLRYCGGFVDTEDVMENGRLKEVLRETFSRGNSNESELAALISLYVFNDYNAVGTDHSLERVYVPCAPREGSMDYRALLSQAQVLWKLTAMFLSANTITTRRMAKRQLDTHIMDMWRFSGKYKTEFLIQLLQDRESEAHRAIFAGEGRTVFYFKHRPYAKKFHEALCAAFPRVGACYLDGESSENERSAVIHSIAADAATGPKFGVFLLKALGDGIDLVPLVTRIVVAELDFKPSAMRQCEKRIHRRGAVQNARTFWLLVDTRAQFLGHEKSYLLASLRAEELAQIAQTSSNARAQQAALDASDPHRFGARIANLEAKRAQRVYSSDEWIMNRLNYKSAVTSMLFGGDPNVLRPDATEPTQQLARDDVVADPDAFPKRAKDLDTASEAPSEVVSETLSTPESPKKRRRTDPVSYADMVEETEDVDDADYVPSEAEDDTLPSESEEAEDDESEEVEDEEDN